MGLLEQASLVVTPNAVKAGKLYSVIPNNGTGDLDVVRATSATRVNSAGLIEIPVTNLLLRSEEFDNAYWVKVNASITQNVIISPNGTLTADLIESTIADGLVRNTNVTGTIGTVYTVTFYIKNNNATQTLFLIRSTASCVSAYINWSGSTISSITNKIGTTNFTSVGDNWYKITTTYTAVENDQQIRIYPQNSGIGKVYAWGVQLETGNLSTEYIPTTSVIRTRFAGITQDGGSASNIPRLDYTNGSCPAILVEPQRTNFLTWSDDFGNAVWAKTGVAINENVSVSPSGMSSADRMTGNGALGEHRVSISNASFTSGLTYTLSFFVKKDTNDFVQLTFGGTAFTSLPFANYNINSGILGTNGGGASSTITSVGNGWFRCTISAIANATANDFIFLNLVTSSSVGRREPNTLSTSVFIWGAQLEAGSNATSLIPTTTGAVTRNADVITKTGASTLIGQIEGTLLIKGTQTARGVIFRLTNSISTNNSVSVFNTGDFNGRVSYDVTKNGVRVSNASPTTPNIQPNKNIIIKYSQTTIKVFINGVLFWTYNYPTSTDFTAIIDKIEFGSLTDVGLARFDLIAIWKTQITDQQAIKLTTL